MSISTGDKVSWNSSGGTARGIVRQIVRDGNVPNIPVKVTGSKEEPAARIEIVDDEGKPTGEMVGHKLSTLRKSAVDVVKARYANDIFTTEMEARARSMDLGLNGATHVHEYDGQAVYMPGESHRAYLEFYRASEGMEVAEGPESERMDPTEALRAVVAEIMQKADYQGEEVTLNKPFRLPSGSSKKFGVYVKDGDKTKKVTFGSPDMEIRRDDPDARRNFRARHNCDTATDKTSARYWSCRMWEEDMTVSEMTKVDTGDRVSWNSSGGTARGIVRQIVRDGTVPDIPVKVTGTKEEPAARIEIVDDEGKPTGEMVGHKLDTLRKADNQADITGKILKTDEEQRMVWGWASVVTEKGEPVVDRQGDVIEPETLVKAVGKFMEHVRVGKQMHNGDQIGVVVHSIPITKEIGDSLGIQSDREGWIVAFKVYDDDVWSKVKSGELAAFSIGGRAVKEDYNG